MAEQLRTDNGGLVDWHIHWNGNTCSCVERHTHPQMVWTREGLTVTHHFVTPSCLEVQ